MTVNNSSEVLISGNEAFARGALEAGIGFCASYPGTPSTEITSTLIGAAKTHDIYVEWSTNEKVALEACAGASWGGVPAICPMKSLGLNVASDFLLNLNLSGSGPGGLIIIVCDDPRGHSSSNEQDSRFYAKASYLPLLEPSTCQQAKDIIPIALGISKKYQIPVLVRSTTRLSHSRALVKLGNIPERDWSASEEIPNDLYNVPNPHLRHRDLLDKLDEISKEFGSVSANSTVDASDAETLVIGTGVAHRYALEAATLFDSLPIEVANLVTSHPLPSSLLEKWIRGKKKVLFVEEVDPFVEDQIMAMCSEMDLLSTQFFGKCDGTVPSHGELNTDRVVDALAHTVGMEIEFSDASTQDTIEKVKSLLVPRALTFCTGCTHRNVYWAIRKIGQRLKGKLVVAGDIGCYSLGVFYDHAMDTMQSMGSGIGTACGLGQLQRFGFDNKIIAVAGDSTFYHSCFPALVNAKHKGADVTFIVMDNETTAMTGFQPHPGSGQQHDSMQQMSIEQIVRAVGPDHFARGSATDIPATIDLIADAIERPGLKVLILDSICRLEEQRRDVAYEDQTKVVIDVDNCLGEKCKICVAQFSCPALEWNDKRDHPIILEYECIRCGACIAVCPHDALKRE
ncbi:MAG: thiamine pyrophosphate-dependent enzyme [Candidatus Thorarchaeota archaeon]|jgi:indolepyruvate ferredoxin oxidoreductase alpha subunit